MFRRVATDVPQGREDGNRGETHQVAEAEKAGRPECYKRLLE